MSTNQSKRLLALDIMRGMTIAGMILVNNAGNWHSAFEPLRHAKWCGLTPTDLVFPFFMFIMGVSTYMSLRKSEFKPSTQLFIKVLRRAIVIFAIGLGLTWLSKFIYGTLADGKSIAEAANTLSELRILGVFQRLALSYGLGAIIAVLVKHKWLPWIAGGLLVLYAVILTVGHGFEYADCNIIARFDRAIIGDAHMYRDRAFGEPFIFDPEGLLSTLPSVAHVLIGFLCGSLICRTRDNSHRINSLFIIGSVMMFTGLLLSYGIPLNKKVWSPTFVLTTCGMAATLLALLIWIIDIKGWKRWTGFFRAFGINPLYLYIQSAVLAYLFGAIHVSTSLAASGTTTLNGWVYLAILDPLCGHDAQWASCLWAILFVFINWIPGYILQRRNIIIKI
ncbi:MAG: DUF5009 domain-containing protein [Muribaculaceae bacterium]|nr:DUF5009 domain-containing protein [Muribaculaceae bacterium]